MEKVVLSVTRKIPSKKKSKNSVVDFDPMLDQSNLRTPVKESKSRGGVVFTFGRMNPPTVGHEKLVQVVERTAKQKGYDAQIYLSHSHDSDKNPLTYDQKIKYAQKAFGRVVVKSSNANVILILKALDKKYDNVCMVVGSDRVKEFTRILSTYNGRDFHFDSVDVVSAGERDPDSDSVSGMSASKMRAAAKGNDFASFKRGLPRKLVGSAKEIFDTLSKNVSEHKETNVDTTTDLNEAPLNFVQRRKKALVMRKYRKKIQTAKKKMAHRIAKPSVLKKRSRKHAIELIRQKVAGEKKGKSYRQLSAGEKIQIDKRVASRKTMVTRLAKRLLPQIRRAEMSKFKKEDVDRLQELSNKKLAQYVGRAIGDRDHYKKQAQEFSDLGHLEKNASDGDVKKSSSYFQKAGKLLGKSGQRHIGIHNALHKIATRESVEEARMRNPSTAGALIRSAGKGTIRFHGPSGTWRIHKDGRVVKTGQRFLRKGHAEDWARKNIKESVQLDEISQDIKDRYVRRASSEHGMANFAKRSTSGKEQEYWAHMEKKRKKGISRALKDAPRIPVKEGITIPGTEGGVDIPQGNTVGDQSRKRFHNMLNKDGTVKIDKRFKTFRDKNRELVQNDESYDVSEAFERGDTVVVNRGVHKGDKHEIIHDHGDGHYNVRPLTLRVKYRMGAAKVHKNDMKPISEMVSNVDAFTAKMFGAFDQMAKRYGKSRTIESMAYSIKQMYKTNMTARELANTYRARQLSNGLKESGGAGEEGTDKLKKKYKKDTPGQGMREQSDLSELSQKKMRQYRQKADKERADAAYHSAVYRASARSESGDRKDTFNSMAKRESGRLTKRLKGLSTVDRKLGEDMDYKVDIAGLPPMYMGAKNPSEVKKKLRLLLKKPDSIQGVERVTKGAVKKYFRDKAQGKEPVEEVTSMHRVGLIDKIRSSGVVRNGSMSKDQKSDGGHEERMRKAKEALKRSLEQD